VIHSSACKQCGTDFLHSQKNRSYCTLDCFYKSRRGTWPTGHPSVERTCEHCAKTYSGPPSKNLRYCSRACQWLAQTTEDSTAARKNERTRTLRRETRLETLGAYGGACACCGETEEAFLQIDHIDGGGNQHRQAIRPSSDTGRAGAGVYMYRWLKDRGYPTGFQILCANCNMAKERPGGCPHRGGG
jgi:hypothetical protein